MRKKPEGCRNSLKRQNGPEELKMQEGQRKPEKPGKLQELLKKQDVPRKQEEPKRREEKKKRGALKKQD